MKCEMGKEMIFYLIVFTYFPIFIQSSEDFTPTDYELYGPTLAANDQVILAIQNRTGISFSAVFNYIGTSPIYCSVTYTPTSGSGLYATMLAVAENGVNSISDNRFVFIAYSVNNVTTYLYFVSINFNSCQLNILNATMMFNTTYPYYSVLGVNSNGTMAFYLSNTNFFIQSLISPYTTSGWIPIGLSSSYNLIPMAIDLEDNWGILGAYRQPNPPFSNNDNFRPTIYVIQFTNCFTYMNSSCFKFTLSWQMSYSDNWQTFEAPANDAVLNSFYSLYDMSVSINDQNAVLWGVQSVNTVFRLTASSGSLSFIGSRYLSTIPSIGFGKGVGWLDNTTAAILLNNFTIDYIQWRSSTIELYPITASNSLSNSISAYASFPNSRQQLWSGLNPRLISMLALPGSGSLIYMDYVGTVHVLRPSNTGYFVDTTAGLREGNCMIYLAPTLQCPSGTIKNLTASGKDLFRYCLLCPEGSFYIFSNRSNASNQCSSCNTTTQFCPWGSVAALPISVLDIQSQAQVYPESPENDAFEDILLINMFNIDFPTNCLAKQPFFLALVIMGIGCLLLLLMGILKLTRKCKKQRRTIKSIFKQTDLIGEGELWIGGVASFAIIVIAVFAYKFSSGFIHQYPIETASDATFACDPTLRNAKFSTSMQSLGIPVLEEEQPLFDMLDNQPFTLNVAFINTDFSEQNLDVSQVLGSILLDLPRTTTIVMDGLLAVSTNLTSHSTTINFNVSSNSAVGGLRVGLSGPSMTNANYFVQELNFSYAFNHSNRTTTQDPMITIQLIKLINITKPLSSNDLIQYSALWIPTFIKNDDQLFYTESDFQLYHVQDNTILTIQITEATYYIFNTQEPITKITEVIFTDILFTTMCIELFALAFLFYKLAIAPFFKWLIGLCTGSNKTMPKGNSGPGCPYCRSIDPETLPSNRLPIMRAEQNIPIHPIRRQTPDIAKLHTISAPPDFFY